MRLIEQTVSGFTTPTHANVELCAERSRHPLGPIERRAAKAPALQIRDELARYARGGGKLPLCQILPDADRANGPSQPYRIHRPMVALGTLLAVTWPR